MKNIFTSIIAYTIAFVIGFFSLTGVSFAAMVMTPATAPEVGRTEATISAKVANIGLDNAAVWFEWGETSSLEKPVVGMGDVFSEGYFTYHFTGLKENTTYYFRAVVMDNEGVTVHSPTTTFTTGEVLLDPKKEVSETVTEKKEPVLQPLSTPTIVRKTNTTNTKESSVKKEPSASATSAKKVSSEKTNTTATAVSNANVASVLGVGGGVLPGTLIGWLVLFVVLFVMVLLVHMIYDSNEKRKKALERAAQEARVASELPARII